MKNIPHFINSSTEHFPILSGLGFFFIYIKKTPSNLEIMSLKRIWSEGIYHSFSQVNVHRTLHYCFIDIHTNRSLSRNMSINLHIDNAVWSSMKTTYRAEWEDNSTPT